MAKIRNASGEDRTLSAAAGGRLVLAGAVIDVPDEDVYGYTQQSIWEPVDDDAQAAHDEAHAAYEAALRVDLGLPEPAQDQPAGNASREEWAAFVVTAGLASEDEISGLGRDEIRDTYKQEG